MAKKATKKTVKKTQEMVEKKAKRGRPLGSGKSAKKAARSGRPPSSDKSPKLLLNPEINKDKEFQTLLPPLPTEVRDALEESIRNEGLREALTAWKENEKLILIDGYNRLKFCEKHGKDYRVIVKSFNDREAVKEWMWENQESRRNMTPYQRIEVVLKFEGIVKEKAKKNQRAAGGAVSEIVNKAKVDQIRTNEVLGKRAGVSYATVGKVRDIQKKITDGVISREVLGELREGKVSINKIYNLYCKCQAPKKKPDKDITERSNSFIKSLNMQVARSFQQTEDCTSLYDRIIEWAKAKKAGLEE